MECQTLSHLRLIPMTKGRQLQPPGPLNNQTLFYYQPNATHSTPFGVGQSLVFNNGNSVVSKYQYKDALGRSYVEQRAQSPSSSTFDSVSRTFDSIGRPSAVSQPCSA